MWFWLLVLKLVRIGSLNPEPGIGFQLWFRKRRQLRVTAYLQVNLDLQNNVPGKSSTSLCKKYEQDDSSGNNTSNNSRQ